ncbi:MAG: hypothetical protein OHK0029_42990 [Armatimonadaceae bacterium]
MENRGEYSGLRRRVGFLGVPLSLLAFWLVVRIEQKDLTGLPTGIALYYHVVFLLALLVGGNVLLRRFAPGLALSRVELLYLFSALSLGSAFACWEYVGTILPAIAFPAYWKDTDPAKAPLVESILRTLPDWIIIHNPEAANLLFKGRGTMDGWMIPLIVWGLLLVVTLMIADVAAQLVFPRWHDEEKLAFPLVELPLAMTEPRHTIWRSRLFWTACLLTFGLQLTNGLSTLYPAIPHLTEKMIVFPPDPTNPASLAVGPIRPTFYPMAIGIAYFLPTDVLFSCWFFFVVGRLQCFIAGSFGAFEGSFFQFGGNMPGLPEQNAGALLMLAVIALWNLRKSFEKNPSDFGRGLLILGIGAAVWMGVLLLLGIPMLIVLLTLLIAGLMGLLVGRIRAEMGLPVHNLQFLCPDLMLPVFFGTGTLPPAQWTGLVCLHGITRSQQGNLFPHFLEARHLQARAGADAVARRRYRGFLILTGVVSALVGPWIMLQVVGTFGLFNTPGGYNPFPGGGWNALGSWIARPSPPDIRALVETGFGAAGALFLTRLRLFWPASPFNPLGFALSGMWGLGMVVFPFFYAWCAKTLILRFGGLRAYQNFTPFAYGIIFGDFAAGMFWTALSMAVGHPTYRIWI